MCHSFYDEDAGDVSTSILDKSERLLGGDTFVLGRNSLLDGVEMRSCWSCVIKILLSRSLVRLQIFAILRRKCCLEHLDDDSKAQSNA